jgi:hypothetical protein
MGQMIEFRPREVENAAVRRLSPSHESDEGAFNREATVRALLISPMPDHYSIINILREVM